MIAIYETVSPTGERGQSIMRNILFLLVDDGGFELGPYGNNITHTPNLDQLAKDGVVFTNHHVQPFCSPTRLDELCRACS